MQAGGRWYNVETGRRDGTISNVIEAQNNLPGPTVPVANAITLFNSKGLNVTDFVLLLGKPILSIINNISKRLVKNLYFDINC